MGIGNCASCNVATVLLAIDVPLSHPSSYLVTRTITQKMCKLSQFPGRIIKTARRRRATFKVSDFANKIPLVVSITISTGRGESERASVTSRGQ